MKNNLYQLLESTAAKFPDKVALIDDKKRVTFSEWLAMSQGIGSVIAKSFSGVKNMPVLVFVDRSIDGLIGFMGVVSCGNFYVPIDSKMPASRVKLIIDTLNPIAAISVTAKDAKTLEEAEFKGMRIDFAEAVATEADSKLLDFAREEIIDLDPVYSIFTSGSTGVPKGAVISHRGALDLADWLVETFGFDESDTLGNQTPFYFDGSVKDIMICLKTGATIRVIGKKYFTFPKLLMDLLNAEEVTSLLWATSAIVLIGNSDILDMQRPKHVKRVFFAGEAMPAKQLRKWQVALPDAQFVNLYGPTEITVDCTYYVVPGILPDDSYVPIGIPCNNKGIVVLNEDDCAVTPGEIGELCVRGSGVGLGYFGNWEKTDEVFVQNPLNPYYRDIIYRTGDLVKYADDGNLLFVSRKDFQVKHNGNRIELGEIEVAVNALPTVANACCVFDAENDKIILFYDTLDNADVDVINSVKNRIPKYMFPNEVYRLEHLPHNLNDKIDRTVLKKLYETEYRNS